MDSWDKICELPSSVAVRSVLGNATKFLIHVRLHIGCIVQWRTCSTWMLQYPRSIPGIGKKIFIYSVEYFENIIFWAMLSFSDYVWHWQLGLMCFWSLDCLCTLPVKRGRKPDSDILCPRTIIKKKWENLFFAKENLGFLANLSQKCPFLIRDKANGTWIKINSIFRKRDPTLHWML